MAEPEAGRQAFLAAAQEPWETFRLLGHWALPERSREQQVQDLADEAAILDLVVSYVSSHDAKDLDWTLSVFSPDNEPTSDGVPRREALARQYTMYNYLTHNFSRHRIANLLVRVLEGGQEAWMTGYWHVSRTGYPGDVTARFGHYFWRVVKIDGQWKIGDRRGSGVPVWESEFEDDDFPLPAPPAGGMAAAPAAGTALPPAGGGHAAFAELSGDWLAADRWLWGLSPRPDELGRLLDERAARELLAVYAYAFDAQDWGWFGSLFADEACLVTPAGSCEGKAAIVEAFRHRQQGIAQSTLRYANPVLRAGADGGDGWLSAAFHLATMDDGERRTSTFGRVFGRLSRHGGGWRIADWRVFPDEALSLKPASNRSRTLPMPDLPPERERFDSAVNRGAWAARKWLIDLPAADDSDQAQLRRLGRELQLRELLTAYAAALDAKEPDRLMAFFRDDAVVTASTGRFRYRDRIRAYVEAHVQDRIPSFHRLMNTAVRLAPGGSEGWVSTYFYAVRPSQRRAADGHLLGHVVEQDGVWKFADLVVSVDRARTFPA